MNTGKETTSRTITIVVNPLLILIIVVFAFIGGIISRGYYDTELGLTAAELSADAPEYDESRGVGDEDSGIVTDEDGSILNDEPSSCGISV